MHINITRERPGMRRRKLTLLNLNYQKNNLIKSFKTTSIINHALFNFFTVIFFLYTSFLECPLAVLAFWVYAWYAFNLFDSFDIL